ncbi:hypothetical protein KY316_00660 [Candidatus Woesearchaeota archaeon]|nr:hypothetical protein [Candidatus Woesearchaeota archaeon]
MRRITQRRKEKKNLLVPLFIIAIMVLSGLGYAMFQADSSNVIKFNGFKFTKVQDKFWRTNAEGYAFDFYFSPQDLESIPTSKFELPSFVYLTSDPEAEHTSDQLMTIEVAKFELKNQLNALGHTIAMNFSNQVTCDDATSSTAVVDLDIGNETAIDVNGNCIKIRGSESLTLVAARDKFLMQVLGVY